MASACGKVILLGEHTVVYGAPAIAAGIDDGAEATARRSGAAEIRLGARTATPDDGTEAGRAFAALLAALGAPAMSVDVTLTQPAGVGLGASAAIAVATARAVLDAMDGDAPDGGRDDVVREGAAAWERVFHGNPSGIDAATAALGGCIYYTRADGPSRLRAGRPLHLAIAIAGPPAATREMVAGVARLRQRRPQVVDKATEGVTALVNNARLCIEAGDVRGLGKLLDLNQMLLSGLFVSTDGIERACRLARDAGALGAKLTGAGGGGCVVALAESDTQPILDAWRIAGLECVATVVGVPREAP